MEALNVNAASAPLPRRVLLFDGVCGFCNRFVNFFLARDPDGLFVFAPLQGETAARLRALHPQIPTELDTLVLIEDGQVYMFSDSALTACARLPGPWRHAGLLRAVPRPLRDFVYKQIAKHRYAIWGKEESCRVPSDSESARFLP